MKTGYFTEQHFAWHENLGGHPENQRRLEAIERALDSAGLCNLRNSGAAREATETELLLCHTAEHYTLMKELSQKGGAEIDRDTRLGPRSFAAAGFACGATLAAAHSVVSGELDNAFAVVRPPGHHAESNRAMGFCIFNNVAVAARYLQTRHGIERVAILDWDVHHGNGTQEIFYADPTVFFASVHQSPLYPYTGRAEEAGTAAAMGTTLNVPLPAGCGDEEYFQIWEGICAKAEEFNPDFILVSAGFDAHVRDPLGGMHVTAEGFAKMTARTKRLAASTCDNRLACVLEGGYDPQGLSESVVAVLQELQR